MLGKNRPLDYAGKLGLGGLEKRAGPIELAVRGCRRFHHAAARKPRRASAMARAKAAKLAPTIVQSEEAARQGLANDEAR
jgi:hypothetical protein